MQARRFFPTARLINHQNHQISCQVKVQPTQRIQRPKPCEAPEEPSKPFGFVSWPPKWTTMVVLMYFNWETLGKTWENEVNILKLGKIWGFQKLRSARSTQSSNRQLSDLEPWLKLQPERHLQLSAEGISTMDISDIYLSKCSMDNWLICVDMCY